MRRTNVLVDNDWVVAHGRDSNVVLVEVDEDTDPYDTNDIDGAVRSDWRLDLRDPVPRDFIDRPAFEKLLSGRGITDGDSDSLRGEQQLVRGVRVLVLQGVRSPRRPPSRRRTQEVELDGRPLSTQKETRPATNYVASEPVPGIRAHRHEVVEQIGTKSFVDVRSPDEFCDNILAPATFPQEQPQVGGHVPTAVNVPWSKTAAEDGTFRSEDELRALYKDTGLDDTKDIVVYCRIGERSAHSWFVLHELLGYPLVHNYDGSWVEYGSLVGVPVEV